MSSSVEFEAGWRTVEGQATAWFEAPTTVLATALAGRVVEESPGAAVEVRSTGLRVRLPAGRPTEQVSAAARRLGLAADPTVLQQVGVAVGSVRSSSLLPFWQGVLGYPPAASGPAGGTLVDPLGRDPTLTIRPTAEHRPLRSRLHLDVVRPAAVTAQVAAGEPSGPYGVRHRDLDGNEVDLVPGDALDGGAETADWQVVFSAMACYRVGSSTQQRSLAEAAAGLSDEAGFPLVMDLRPGLVVLDSGKDQWDGDAHGLPLDFAGLAARLQAAARGLAAVADPAACRFVQLFWDAADVDALRTFWAAALGYVPDRRAGVADLVDPRRLNPVLGFQPLDPAEVERLRQRNRLHVELTVPADLVDERVRTVLAAGGRLLEEADGGRRLADPEGNELVLRGAGSGGA